MKLTKIEADCCILLVLYHSSEATCVVSSETRREYIHVVSSPTSLLVKVSEDTTHIPTWSCEFCESEKLRFHQPLSGRIHSPKPGYGYLPLRPLRTGRSQKSPHGWVYGVSQGEVPLSRRSNGAQPTEPTLVIIPQVAAFQGRK